MRGCEVFPLQTCSGKFLLHRLNELIDKVKVGLTRNPFVAPAEVLGIVESFRVVGSHIQYDGKRPLRTNPTDDRIQRKFADWKPQAACALVTDAQETFAIRDDNYVDLRIGTIPQKRGDRVAQ